MTGKEIADRLEKIQIELEQVDNDILMNFQDSRESVVMFLRQTLRNSTRQVESAKFYCESLLKIKHSFGDR